MPIWVESAKLGRKCHFSVDLNLTLLCPLSEFLDEMQMKASIEYSKLQDLAELPTLFLEFNGSEKSLEEQAKAAGETSADDN